MITFFQNGLPCSLVWFWPYSLCKKIKFLTISNYIIVFEYWQDAWVSAHLPWNICADWSCIIPGRSRAHDHQPYCHTYRIHQWDQLWLANHDHAYGLYISCSFKNYLLQKFYMSLFYFVQLEEKTSYFLPVIMINLLTVMYNVLMAWFKKKLISAPTFWLPSS